MFVCTSSERCSLLLSLELSASTKTEKQWQISTSAVNSFEPGNLRRGDGRSQFLVV